MIDLSKKREGGRDVSKRDYKSYHVLEEELMQEEAYKKAEIAKQEQIIDISLYEIEEEQEEPEVANETSEEKESEPKKEHNEKKETSGKLEGEEMNKERDMSFSAYKNSYQTKERSRLVRWSVRLVKMIIFLMLLPLLGILAFAGLSVLGAFLAAAVAVLGSGVFILGIVCFIATQLSTSLIALGISAAIAALSLGSILFILLIMLIKYIITLFNKYRKSYKGMARKGAE